jgi:hypothetical protein
MRSRLLPIAVSILGLSACQPPRTQYSQSKQPIIGGTDDSGDPSVVALVMNTSMGGALCTAEVIAPTVILTAAHCVAASELGPGATFAIATSASNGWNPDPNFPAVKEVHNDPMFDGNNVQNGHDIGIVILESPTTLHPLPFNKSAVDQSMIGQPVRLVGYGASDGTTLNGAGVKRQVTTVLDDFDPLLLHVGVTGMEGCEGDSGGPAFMTINNVETIMGMTSFGNQNCTQGGYYTRVDDYMSFINQYMTNPVCTPMCSGKTCGSDGCGGSCGSCSSGQTCTSAGQCQMPNPICTPMCSGKTCGPDGCGGSCGSCGSGQNCSASGQCISTNACDGPAGQESEPNDHLAQSNALCSDGTLRGTIGQPGDVDYISLTIDQSKQYTIQLTNLPVDMTMSIFKILNSQVTWLGDAPNNHDKADQSFQRFSATGGSYYIKLSGNNGASDASSQYKVILTTQ